METVRILVLIIMGGAAIFYFPVYLLLFIYRSQTWEKRNRPKPSTLIFVLYLGSLCLLIWVAELLSPPGIKFPNKAKQTEAKANLGAIYKAQKEYFAQRHAYAGGLDAFKLLGWEPEGQKRYWFFCGEDFRPRSVPKSMTSFFINVNLAATSATGFTCAAVGNIDNDPDLDYWIINDAKVISQEPGTDL